MRFISSVDPYRRSKGGEAHSRTTTPIRARWAPRQPHFRLKPKRSTSLGITNSGDDHRESSPISAIWRNHAYPLDHVFAFPVATMDNTMDSSTITTLQLLESRLLQLEHMVYGESPVSVPTSDEVSVARQLENLDRRFQALISRVRVYKELHRICKLSPQHSRGYHQPSLHAHTA